MSNRVLIVLTSHDQLGETGEKTGFWLEEFAAPYYVFKDAGAQITLASPLGGQPPLDPKSNEPDFQTAATHRFEADDDAKAQLAETKRLSEVNANDFDAVFYPGGHGPLWDLFENENSIKLVEDFWAQDKVISAVCHASIAFANARDKDGEYIVKGRNVTGFTNSEEDAVQLTDVVPVLVEDTLIARGGKYTKKGDFEPYATRDGNLITGQNPASSEAAAQSVLDTLGSG
ncbi:type 1 glutamine amidotransferase domain-containing protein [uncultured Erythrobacter sp.]|uniref:type 1 glutamine amidotransferase domain-containing protein n=1 Tax=uncultured Erythrobacter sp. TaxID=263913 RepID=UPI00260FBEE0|nr:type 1 glutamine amidotransferase domain-containing protein [uncultured Erythrobacter sp.]